MLWSKSFVQADSLCPKQAVKLRLGHKGTPWAGFKVGSHVHDIISEFLKSGEMPNPVSSCQGYELSIEEMVSAKRLLNNFAEMDVSLPDNAVIEASYYSKIVEGGIAEGWLDCPAWMDRSSDEWDPSRAKGTAWRFQPDAYYLTDNGETVVCIDWKTGWAVPSDDSLRNDIQAITSCAALCEMTGAKRAEFVWVNVRWKKSQSIQKTREEWVELARPIWEACWKKDKFLTSKIEEDQRAGEHCGRCQYSSECLVQTADYQKYDDAELYRYSKKMAEHTKIVRAEMKKRLKERTATLEIGGGVTLGPKMTAYTKWKRGEKAEGMKKVLDSLPDGSSITDVFDIKGSISTWLSQLPEEIREYVEQHTEEGSRQTLVEKEN